MNIQLFAEQGGRDPGREGARRQDRDEDREGRAIERRPEHRRPEPEAFGGHQLEPEDVAARLLREPVRKVQDEGKPDRSMTSRPGFDSQRSRFFFKSRKIRCRWDLMTAALLRWWTVPRLNSHSIPSRTGESSAAKMKAESH